jgi:hypothetical protein
MERIHHNAAWKTLQANGHIELCPSDAYPGGTFSLSVQLFLSDCPTLAEFKAKVTEFRHYNCCYTRCGVAFYV